MKKEIKVEDQNLNADKPSQFSGEAWKSIGKRVIDQIKKDHVQITAAGVAFYFFLALFPTIVAAISLYSLIQDPAQISQDMAQLQGFLPPKTYSIFESIIDPVLKESSSTLGWSFALSILFSLWSANKGTSAIFEGLNISYNELDERGFIKKKLLSLGFTLGGIIVGILSLIAVIAFPSLIDRLGLSGTITGILSFSRWILMAVILIFSLGFLYQIAPARGKPQFKWVSWGAGIATVLWLLASILFSWYVSNFGSYSNTYGSFAAVIILLLWLFLTAFIILIGAEINAEMEHQTPKDTTTGEPKPMGERGAWHADHVADNEEKDEKTT
ncbi:YihY/virulence factor BrkB family protein [Christiangramia fulva]|uniref:YihY/virulence factor BrkB family protein n=1 Tax=Christiangramia fulva TaxID=2126553 RepID=A0A2R3Z4G1_9FLAO|nr:YihY/virulence factor BrkB family protein [Christiangramia fulva]AVR45167.1 YihY/virulence factor BrkB family protein [Christiangramia fulva]